MKRMTKWLVPVALVLPVVTCLSGEAKAQLSQVAINQIAAITADKATRTPAQNKLDSQLIYAARANRNQAVVNGAPQLQADVKILAGGRVLVDITATVSKPLLQQIVQAGGQVISSFPAQNAIRALLPVGAIETLAARKDVRFIQRAVEAQTNRSEAPRASLPQRGKLASHARMVATAQRAARSARIKQMARLAAADGPVTNVGSLTSEGDISHRAAEARTAFGIDGSGIKIGVLSDSVDHLADVQASGDLPADVTVLPGQSGVPGSGEGTAMLEIVHDLVPGAKLFYASAFNGPSSFAQNILDLRAAGCDIIVDDVGYFNESPFQAGVIEKAVQTVCAGGTLYFSSAANSGNKSDGTSGTWVGDFANGGTVTAPPYTKAGNIHNFGGATFNEVASGGSSRHVDLFWSDPLGASANDYDVYVTDSNGAVLRSSTNTQNGTQDPYELIQTLNVGERIVVVKVTGAANRYLYLDTGRGRLAISTSGNTRGHNAPDAANGFGVAATDAGANTPFVGGATNPVETFSSDGPRRMFYNADGSAITPGNFSSTGGKVIQKPDITAADGVVTATPGFNPFFGTSAAAPHAAAIAGLLRSYNPDLTAAQVRSLLQNTALDIETAGTDRDSGVGIIMVMPALQAAPAPKPRLIFDSAALSGGNGNGTVDPNECNLLNVTLRNAIAATGNAVTGINATLSTTTPGVTVTQATSAYPNIAAAGTGVNTTPFQISTSSSFVCGTPVSLTLNVTTANAGTFVISFQRASGGVGTLKAFASTDVPKNIPDDDSTGVDSTVAVSGMSSVAKVTVSVHVTHTYISDLSLSLVGPDGTTVPLVINRGDTGQNFGSDCGSRTVFDDAAGTNIGAGSPPFVGTFQPEQPLSAFNGKTGTAVNGTWKLHAVDGFALDTGTIQCWTLSIAPQACASGGGACGAQESMLSINDTATLEGDGGNKTASFTVTLSSASTKTVTVKYATANGTAVQPGDYTSVSGTLSFAPGETSKTITVTINGDTLDEVDEDFVVNLSSPTNAILDDAQGLGTITDNDAPPSLRIDDVSTVEGASGTKNLVFTVSLSAASGKTLSVQYATADGTATAGSDYTALPLSTLNFVPGQVSRPITVGIKGDTAKESTEKFVVNLSNPVNVTIADAQGTGTIVDDDTNLSLSVNDVAIAEGNAGNKAANFTVTLSVPSTKTVTVDCQTVLPGSFVATPGVDYVAVSLTTLTFAPGQTSKTVAVQVIGDTLDEVDERFLVKLSSPVNAVIVDGEGRGTITDDDAAPTLSIGDVTIIEGNSGTKPATFTVTLSAVSSKTVTVQYTTAAASSLAATGGADYVGAPPTTLTFAPGETTKTFTIQIKGDTLDEPDERFLVKLLNPVNATFADGEARCTITDDDVAALLFGDEPSDEEPSE